MLVNHQGVRNTRGPRRPNTVACDKQHGPETKVTMEEEHWASSGESVKIQCPLQSQPQNKNRHDQKKHVC